MATLTNKIAVMKGETGGRPGKNDEEMKDWKKELVFGDQRSNKQRQELLETLDKYESVFYNGGKLPMVTVGVQHTVRLKEDAAPVACRPRRLSPDEE